MAEGYRNIGICHTYLGHDDIAVKHYYKALNTFQRAHNLQGEARVYNNIGNLYSEIDFNKSVKYFHRALKIAVKLKSKHLEATVYGNIGNVYDEKNELQLALQNYERSLSIFKEIHNSTGVVQTLQNIGAVDLKLLKFKEAESYLLIAIKEAKKYNLTFTIAHTYLSLSSLYLKTSRFLDAEKVLDSAHVHIVKLDNRDLVREIIYARYELAYAKKNYKTALAHLKNIYHRDSIHNAQNIADKIHLIEIQYFQQEKISNKELIITKQKYTQTFYWWLITIFIFIFFIAVTIGTALYFGIQRNIEKDKLKAKEKLISLEQQALMAMMNPHFVFNIMNSIQYFINTREQNMANEVLTGFAKLIRTNLEICSKSYITLEEEINYLQQYLSLEKIRFGDKMNYAFNIPSSVDLDDILIPSMLLQPFVENAVWHGIMPSENGGDITIDVVCTPNDVIINIIDTGIGIKNSKPSNHETHLSRGMKLINDRITLLNKINKFPISINIHQTGEKGTSVSVIIPLK
jgi:tetratricopeptide (TPR) repeat protein